MPTKLLRKAAGVMKDQRSLYLIKISGKKGLRNPSLEAAIIKATSHDESTMDYKNANRVFNWIKTSPTFLRPFFWSLTKRIEKTHSWVVTLKGLMLIHGVFCTKIPTIKKIGRLPFDLSNFHDRYSNSARAWGFSAFVRAYYAFLDQHSSFLSCKCEQEEEEMPRGGKSMERSLSRLHQLQTLLDLLLQIKPYGDGMEVGLVVEAMDCVVIEIFEVYSGICNEVVYVLSGIFSVRNPQAPMALKILKRVATQNSQLSAYFAVCRNMGVLNATEFPPIEQIPEEDIYDIECIIRSVQGNQKLGSIESENARPSRRQWEGEQKDSKKSLRTVITENWEVFNDELEDGGVEEGKGIGGGKKDFVNDFGACLDVGSNGNLNGFLHLQEQPKNLMLL
ncbi:putative clathrin assembly protein At1g25240 [Magnolia sinica]|uniref:putative clathrin assembly protein At1g25240 n=1 Tax=Magnolia sinica TaxID=86752 RepID=UPI00265A45C8|nr:putative clathrin assembly protein At1g25240 [Magnolia sinica]